MYTSSEARIGSPEGAIHVDHELKARKQGSTAAVPCLKLVWPTHSPSGPVSAVTYSRGFCPLPSVTSLRGFQFRAVEVRSMNWSVIISSSSVGSRKGLKPFDVFRDAVVIICNDHRWIRSFLALLETDWEGSTVCFVCTSAGGVGIAGEARRFEYSLNLEGESGKPQWV